MFLARFGYELVRPESASIGLFGGYQENMIAQGEFGGSASRKNYASAKIVVTQADSAQTVEQKYERISTIDTKTADRCDGRLQRFYIRPSPTSPASARIRAGVG